MLQRGDIRENLKLDGSVAGDCIRSYCCSCCVLMQEEKEMARIPIETPVQIQPQSGERMRYAPQ
jgi:hypothetical protein